MLIPLHGFRGKGEFAIIDDGDYALVKDRKWYIDENGYAIDNINRARMHRVIMNPPAGKVIDHINRNTLDNRRANLRICTIAENNKNKSSVKRKWPKHKDATRVTTLKNGELIVLPKYVYPYYKRDKFCSYMFSIRRKELSHKKKGFKSVADAIAYRNFFCNNYNINITMKGEL